MGHVMIMFLSIKKKRTIDLVGYNLAIQFFLNDTILWGDLISHINLCIIDEIYVTEFKSILNATIYANNLKIVYEHYL